MPKSNTPSLQVESNQEHWSNHPKTHWPEAACYTNLHRVPTAGLGCRTDLATARCCKSAAPANLTMPQHCTVQPAHAAFTLQVFNLLPSKAVTWQGSASLGVESNQEHWSNRVSTAGLESKADLATARCCKSAAPANLTMLQHCTGKQIQHFDFANLPMLQVSNLLAATCQSPTLQAFRLKATKSTLTGQMLPSYTNLHRVPTVLKVKQIWPLQDVANLQPLPT